MSITIKSTIEEFVPGGKTLTDIYDALDLDSVFGTSSKHKAYKNDINRLLQFIKDNNITNQTWINNASLGVSSNSGTKNYWVWWKKTQQDYFKSVNSVSDITKQLAGFSSNMDASGVIFGIIAVGSLLYFIGKK